MVCPIIRLISPRPRRCEAAAASPPCEKPHGEKARTNSELKEVQLWETMMLKHPGRYKV